MNPTYEKNFKWVSSLIFNTGGWADKQGNPVHNNSVETINLIYERNGLWDSFIFIVSVMKK